MLDDKLRDEDAVEAVLHYRVGILEFRALGVVPRHHDDGVERDDHEDKVVELFALGDLVHRRHVQPHHLPDALQGFARPPSLPNLVNGVALLIVGVAASLDPPLLSLRVHLVHHLLLRAARLQTRHDNRRQQLHHEKRADANHQRVPQQHGPADGVHQRVRRLVPPVDRQSLKHEQRGPHDVVELDVPVTRHRPVLGVIAARVTGHRAVVQGDAAYHVVAHVREHRVPRGGRDGSRVQLVGARARVRVGIGADVEAPAPQLAAEQHRPGARAQDYEPDQKDEHVHDVLRRAEQGVDEEGAGFKPRQRAQRPDRADGAEGVEPLRAAADKVEADERDYHHDAVQDVPTVAKVRLLAEQEAERDDLDEHLEHEEEGEEDIRAVTQRRVLGLVQRVVQSSHEEAVDDDAHEDEVVEVFVVHDRDSLLARGLIAVEHHQTQRILSHVAVGRGVRISARRGAGRGACAFGRPQ